MDLHQLLNFSHRSSYVGSQRAPSGRATHRAPPSLDHPAPRRTSGGNTNIRGDSLHHAIFFFGRLATKTQVTGARNHQKKKTKKKKTNKSRSRGRKERVGSGIGHRPEEGTKEVVHAGASPGSAPPRQAKHLQAKSSKVSFFVKAPTPEGRSKNKKQKVSVQSGWEAVWPWPRGAHQSRCATPPTGKRGTRSPLHPPPRRRAKAVLNAHAHAAVIWGWALFLRRFLSISRLSWAWSSGLRSSNAQRRSSDTLMTAPKLSNSPQ